MKRAAARTVILELAIKHKLLHKDGRVNYTAFGRACGVPAPTIFRLYNASDDWDMAPSTAKSLVAAFNITEQQARGYELLPWLEHQEVTEYTPTEADLELLKVLRGLPAPDQREVEVFIRAKSVVSKTDES